MQSDGTFSELFEKRGVLLPTLFSVVFVVSLFFVAAAGQNRLAESSNEIGAAEYRARRLAEFLHSIADAESAVRGYVVTGERSYLDPYERAQPAIRSALDDLDQAYADLPVARKSLEGLRVLSDASMGLLRQAVERRTYGFDGAAMLIRTNVGKRTMDQLREVVVTLSAEEQRIFEQAQLRAEQARVQGRWLFALGALLNVLLVVLAGVLISRDLKRRAQLAEALERQRQSLEHEVKERTHELESLSTHLQTVSEQERTALARELHDELGSLLVAARMDLSWLQRRLPTDEPAMKLRWQRVQDSLDAGVNLKRRVVEQLRPTLLDNMGLFAALRWQFQESCGRAGLKCIESYPETEPRLTEAASIAIFRMVQEALTNICKHAKAKSAELAIEVDAGDGSLLVRVIDDGLGLTHARTEKKTGASSHGLASMRHRITALGGILSIDSPAGGGTRLVARLPLSGIVQAIPPEIPEHAIPDAAVETSP